jgi:prepilin-type N-terminal cleavage/methylation domain-containing protein
MTRSHNAGLTLIEILIAIVIIAVGILAAIGLQASALQASGRAREMQEASKIADAELALRRSMVSAVSASSAGDACITFAPGFVCNVLIEACSVGGACAPGASNGVAHGVTVTVTSPRGFELRASTLVANP